MEENIWKKKLTDLKHGHTCLFCQNRDEQISAGAAFIEIGLQRNERSVYLADPETIGKVSQRLQRDGIDTEKESQTGRLQLVSKRTFLEADGSFDPYAMTEFINQAIDNALIDGFAGLRATGDVCWELGGKTDPEVLLVYERILDKLFETRPLVGLCQYRLADFPVRFIRNAIYTHPVAVLDGNLNRSNPYYSCCPFDEAEALHRENLEILFLNLNRR